MKSIAISICCFLVTGCLICYAQPSLSQGKIISAYLYDGTIFTGLDTLNEGNSTDTLHLYEFRFGMIAIPTAFLQEKKDYHKGDYVKLILSDKRSISGSIVTVTSDKVVLKHNILGEINVPSGQINDLKESRTRQPEKWDADPNATRYFFAPSSFMLRKGDGYYQNAYILSNSVNYGITDHFTLGGGVILPILFYVTPKIGYSLGEFVHVGAGIFAGGTYLNSGIGAGIGYGLLTLGTHDYHFTVGAGYGTVYSNEEWNSTRKPIVTLCGNARLNRKFSLITENWLFQLPFDKVVQYTDTSNGMSYINTKVEGVVYRQVAICTAGARLVWEKLSLDLGVLAPVNFQDVNFVLPYIDLVVKF